MMSDRIHLLNNGLPPRQKKNVASQNATLGEVNDALMAERVENENMVKWYMDQVPEKVATMVAQILAANGITMKGPEPIESLPNMELAAELDAPDPFA